MRVNSRVFTEKVDMMDEIQIPNCPSQFKGVAEKLVMMASKPGYSCPDYNTVSQLDKMLMLAFWKEYDGLKQDDFEKWFLSEATMPDLITRARRWLVERHYLILKPDVVERAYEAESKFSKAIKH